MADFMTELSRIRTASSVILLVVLLAWESIVPFFVYFGGSAGERVRHGLKNLVLGASTHSSPGLASRRCG